MSGKSAASTSGKKLRDKVVELARNLGLNARVEVRCARRLYGGVRVIDIVITHPATGKVLGVECKYQETPGTAEQKIVATIQDIAFWPIPGIVVIDGPGFSQHMQGYLISTGKVVWFDDLEDWLRLYFGV
jgi:Na+-translocating ferredoxin:NAD+ oxidoreductase RnfG subunit